MTIYFAYGSNLDECDWSAFCEKNGFSHSSMKPLEAAWLPDMELVSNHFAQTRGGGALNIQPAPGSVVPGMLFELTDEGLEAVRQKEGVRYAVYDEVTKFVLLKGGQELAVTTFILNAKRRLPKPIPMTDEYLEICSRGYKRFGLDEQYLNAAANQESGPVLDAVFVYGTLMRGQTRYSIIRDHNPVCTLLSEVEGQLHDCGAFPGLFLSTEATVHGEFVRVDKIREFLQIADVIEGFEGFGDERNLFRRTLVEVGIGDGRQRLAWTYVLARNVGAPISSGSWRAHRRQLDQTLDLIVESHAQCREDFWDALHIWEHRFHSLPEKNQPHTKETAIKALMNGSLSERTLAGLSGLWSGSIEPSNGGI